MKRVPATILLLAGVVAADVGGQSRPATRSSSPSDAEVHPSIPAFEDRGEVFEPELSALLNPDSAPAGRASGDRAAQLRRATVRALGRLERRELIAPLTGVVTDPSVADAAQLGLLLTLRAHAPAEGDDELIARVVNGLITSAAPAIVGHLPYSRAGQFDAAETRLTALLEDPRAPRAAVARALEALARRNRRLGTLKPETIALLRKGATWELPYMRAREDGAIVFESTAALVAAGAMDGELIEAALGEESAEVRRLAALALYGGANVGAAERTRLVRLALDDRDWTVRYDGLRAWIRRETIAGGCAPIVAALSDDSPHVALAALDALADRCVGSEDAEALTTRLVSELRTPPNVGSWHREAHALVAAARRAPERAAIAMPTFRQHLTWQVRMYAARAAAILNDVFTLQKLAFDSHDNVRDAALPPLRRLEGAGSDAAFIAALGRKDYQLVRTAAIALKGAAPDRYLLRALIDALERITRESKETSRDTRLALIERIREQDSTQVAELEKLLTDFDPRIAAEAAAAVQAMTGVTRSAASRPLPRAPLPTMREIDERLVARVELDSGRFFEIEFDKTVAPLAYARIVRLVRNKYYDGLSFHRVVPNFVVQGGSPGANEYVGDGPFMRDELSTRPHSRGTAGLSTRGRHTGDAQIFINLADNRTLDFEYTVFGAVPPRQMPIVDGIQEGTRITRVQMLPPTH